jgi:phosphoglycolate phosphatase
VNRGKFSDVRAVLIDLDGTLLDTIPDLAEAANRTLAEIGRARLPIDTVRTYIGKGIPVLVKRCLTGHLDDNIEPDAAELARALPVFKRHYAEVNGAQTTIYPKVFEGLTAMRDKGLHLACITNKAGDFTLPLLAWTGLAPFFPVVVSGDTTPEKKPHPAPLLHACAAFGVAPNQAVMIGDSTNDALAGRNAGCRVLCVPYGYNEGGDVHDIDCDAIVDSLLEAAALLQPSMR